MIFLSFFALLLLTVASQVHQREIQPLKHEWWLNTRGGATTNQHNATLYQQELEATLRALGERFGPAFVKDIEQNIIDHKNDCEKSCQSYFCFNETTVDVATHQLPSLSSHSFGSVPPEDFAGAFGFPLDLIKVTNEPLVTPAEAQQVTKMAEAEGILHNQFPSGKYKLGGDWLTNLPNTRVWFNELLQTRVFGLLAREYPEIVKDASTLRAHSVSLLRYNASHPRTDVHVDDGILALTVAMTPRQDYTGGGTYFEHWDEILEMEVGHATVRPGNVRHGGHRVTSGERYVLGAFFLLEDRVEHVRRLKNRGTALRRQGDLIGAAQRFEWALALNPECTTCLKDWAEVLFTSDNLVGAETKIRQALDLLDKDSDAWFTLGVILSKQEKDAESIEAYKRSIALNTEDAELCYNLAVKLGERGDRSSECDMYSKAVATDPDMGGAWLNWGTTLAEQSLLDDAESKFLRALATSSLIVKAKAMVNLGLVYYAKSTQYAASNKLPLAKETVDKAKYHLETALPLLESTAKDSSGSNDIQSYLSQYKAMRMQVYRLTGQLFAGMGDLAASEQEFRDATSEFPNEKGAWFALARVLDLRGKKDEAADLMSKFK